MKRLMVVATISVNLFATHAKAAPSNFIAPALAAYDDVIFTQAGKREFAWLVTAKSTQDLRWVDLALVRRVGQRLSPAWTIRIPDAYVPVVYAQPQWQYGGNPVLLLRYNLGAASTILNVIGLSPHGPVRLQQLQGGLFSTTYAMSDDGNGDLRMIEGYLPFGFHCYDWAAKRSMFVERPCKTLTDPRSAAGGPKEAPHP